MGMLNIIKIATMVALAVTTVTSKAQPKTLPHKKCSKKANISESAKEISCYPLAADSTVWDLRHMIKSRCEN